MNTAPQPLLELDRVAKHFGGLIAVDHCSFHVHEGRITGLIGPNGAGKTTAFNLIAGVLKPDAGEIRFRGESLVGESPERIVHRGLVRTFQIPRAFGRLTVWENVMFAGQRQPGERALGALLRRRWRPRERQLAAQAGDILDLLELRELQNEPASSLSGGQRKLLELARALMTEPQLILLDEPIAGVNPTLARKIAEKIVELNDDGMSFLIIEHDIDLIMRLCHRVIAMHQGRTLVEGDPDTVRHDERLLEAYLGGQAA